MFDSKPTQHRMAVYALGLWVILAASATGCATQSAQKHIEQVAKDWCMTIRASQVVPVYPLTADLQVGDVFLVQTPISTQEKQYKERGFLSLDDHRHRLRYTNFSSVYFDGYWKDSYSKTPHESPAFTNADSISTNQIKFTVSQAPRVMFPTYSFRAQSGFGLSAAFPIEGIPVALGFLRSDQVNGSVSISDARTYAGDETELRDALAHWAEQPAIMSNLAATSKFASPTVVFLRVITRIYAARAMEVSLFHANQTSQSGRAGLAPDLKMLDSITNFVLANSNLVASLNQFTNSTDLAAAGGSFKFTSASESSVGMKQTFDQLLVVGYLAFDVPVYENGTLGVPLPTFQRLEGKTSDWIRPALEARDNSKILSEIASKDPLRALNLMKEVATVLQGNEFRLTLEMLNQLDEPDIHANDKEFPKTVQTIVKQFKRSAIAYLSRPYWLSYHAFPQRLKQYNSAFDDAFAKIKPLPKQNAKASDHGS